MAPPPAVRPALLVVVAIVVAAAAPLPPIDVVEITEGPVPPALAGEGETETASATAAASVEPIQPGPAFGFSVFSTGVPNFGAYRFQLVDGTPEVVRSWVQAVADQLISLTSIQFSVDPGTVPRWGGLRQRPLPHAGVRRLHVGHHPRPLLRQPQPLRGAQLQHGRVRRAGRHQLP